MSSFTPDPRIDGDAATAALFARTAAEAPAADAAALLAAVPRPAPADQFSFLTRRSFAMKFSILSLTAAGLLAAVLFWPIAATAAVTLEDVGEAVAAAPFVSAVTYAAGPDGEFRRETFIAATAAPVRLRTDAGWITQVRNDETDRGFYAAAFTGKFLAAQVGAAAVRERNEAEFVRELFAPAALQEGAMTEPEPVMLDGRPALVFTVRRQVEGWPEPFVSRVWADAGTKLPVRIESGEGDELRVIKDFIWSEKYDPRLFAAKLPDVVERAIPGLLIPAEANGLDDAVEAVEVGTPDPPQPSEVPARGFQDPVMTAGVGYGSLRLGMTPAEVEEATGVPTFPTGPETFWFYLPGRNVTARGTNADGVVQIYAGDRGGFRKFPGRSTEGIAYETPVAEVDRLLGPPPHPVEEPRFNYTARRFYPDRRFWVLSSDGKASQISVWSPAAEKDIWFREMVESYMDKAKE